MMELVVAIAPWLGEWVTVKIAEAVLGGVNTQLKTQDLEKALKTCAATADRQVKLFFRCEPRFIPKLLDQVFQLSIEELQRPLKNNGTPQVAYLVAAFKKALEEHLKIKQDINESLIKPWLEVFATKYFETTNTYLRFQIAKEDYLKKLANYFDDVKFAGIAVEGRDIDKSAKLVDIFVMPDVVESPNQTLATFDSREITEISQRQAELIWEQRQLAQSQDTSRKLSAQQLLTENNSKKIVLLGAPGLGKTTLMNYFAVKLTQQQIAISPSPSQLQPPHPPRSQAQPGNAIQEAPPPSIPNLIETDLLPLLIRIRDLARQTDISILQYLQHFAHNNLSVKQLPTGFFENWLEDGKALILLDGLDEIADSAKRDDIVRKIECFLEQFNRNRAIITSRPAGYRRDFFRTEEFTHYTLQFFDDAKIELFIKQWYQSRCENPAEAQERQESLQKALAQQGRIKLLAQNPLLLTIIALIHRYQARLPRQRHQLYDKAVKTLLINWDEEKYYSDEKKRLKYVKPDDIPRLMEQLAYWIHTQGGTGDQEGGTLIDKQELIAQLSKFIAEQQHLQRHQAKAEAERFVEHIRERAGLLIEQGQDCYAFVHKTFQEYLAAQEIWDKQQGDGDEVVLEHIEKYLHDPHWREVLLLLIAQQHRKKTAKFLKHIREQTTPYEQWLHRNLFFAGSCLAEDLEVADEMVTDILQQLVNLEISDSQQIGEEIRNQVFKTLCSLNESRFEAQTLQLLKESGERIDKVRLQEYRAALGEKEEGIADLLPLLSDLDSSVSSSAADALRKLGNGSAEVVQALLPLLRDEDSSVSSSAADALRKLGKNSSYVAAAIVEWILQHQDSDYVGSGIDALWELVVTDE